MNNARRVNMQRRDQLEGDLDRPRYHYLPPANWMNDPNGLIQWKGEYHLFYQYNPYGPIHARIHWGHAVSRDLVHWTDLPVALTPAPDGSDAEGCWSGCAVDNNGVPTLLYTGVHPQVVCMATGSDDLVSWQSYSGNPVIKGPPLEIAEQTGGHFRDPFVWKEEEDGYWYMLMGTKQEGVGGLTLLYCSSNLIHWEYLHPLMAGDLHRQEPLWTGTMWECPNFLIFGDRRVLLISIQAASNELLHTLYFVGDYQDRHFTPRLEGILVYGDYFYAPQVMRDEQGRYLMWGWIREGREQRAVDEAGWAGVMSLPIVISLEPGDNLKLEPAPELTHLRRAHRRYENLEITPGESNFLRGIGGDCLEIVAEFEPDQLDRFEFKLRCSPNGEEETRLIYRSTGQQIVLDREKSSLNPAVDRAAGTAPVKLEPGETLKLHIFLDRSVVEVFVNYRSCLASRIYPTRGDSLGVNLNGLEGVVKLKSLDIWTIESIWESN
ncbi:MAG TPA: glycoside hydrolase family 32 protein [Chloroflexia bacterium]|nr:glycoside hydrolase family 32 protein [Chloroflexia bacterium]